MEELTIEELLEAEIAQLKEDAVELLDRAEFLEFALDEARRERVVKDKQPDRIPP